MKEGQRDLMCLCISSIGITFMHLWPAIFTYYTSFCYYKDPNTKVNQIYATYFWFVIGQFICSAVFPYIFFVFGTKFVLFFLAFAEIVVGYFSLYNVSFSAVCLVMFEKGLLFQGVMTACNIILSEKFENGILKVKYVNTSRVCLGIILLFICQFMVNPNNEPQNVRSKNGDYFFHENISKKFEHFLILYSITSFLTIMISCLFIESPLNYRSKIMKFLGFIFGQNTFEFEVNNITNSVSNINTSVSLSSLREKSIIRSLSQSGLNDQLVGIKNNIKRTKNIDFVFVQILGMIIAINSAISYYCIDIYKYIALILNFGDMQISIVFTFGVTFYIASSYLASFLWDKYGFDHTLFALNFANIFNLFNILISRKFFLYEILLGRFCYGFQTIFQDLFCYGLFDTLEAMLYMKYFVFYNALGEFIQVMLNFALFDEVKYKHIFAVLSLLSVVGFLLHGKYLYKKIPKSKQLKKSINQI